MKYSGKISGINISVDLGTQVLQIENEKLLLNKKDIDDVRLCYIKLNSKCNMSCKYCFQKEDSKLASREISLYDYKKVIYEMAKKPNINLVLYGGEPLLDRNINNWEELLSLLNDRNDFVLFTNAIVSDKALNFIVSNGNRFKTIVISMDDSLVRKDSNTYLKKKVKVIQILIENKIDIAIQINVIPGFLLSITKLIRVLKSMLDELESIPIIINPILHVQESNKSLYLCKEFLDLKHKFKNNKLYLNHRTLTKVAISIGKQTIDTKRCNIGNDIVIDFERKKIYACPQNIKNSTIGYFTNNLLYMNEDLLDEMQRYSKKENRICSMCIYRFYCSYGCYIEKDIHYPECKKDVNRLLKFIFKNLEDFISSAY